MSGIGHPSPITEGLGLRLLIKPSFELGSFFFADNDRLLVAIQNNLQFAIEIAMYLGDAFHTADTLPIEPKKEGRIK